MDLDKVVSLLIGVIAIGTGLLGVVRQKVRIVYRADFYRSPPEYLVGKKAVLAGMYLIVIGVIIVTLPYW